MMSEEELELEKMFKELEEKEIPPEEKIETPTEIKERLAEEKPPEEKPLEEAKPKIDLPEVVEDVPPTK